MEALGTPAGVFDIFPRACSLAGSACCTATCACYGLIRCTGCISMATLAELSRRLDDLPAMLLCILQQWTCENNQKGKENKHIASRMAWLMCRWCPDFACIDTRWWDCNPAPIGLQTPSCVYTPYNNGSALIQCPSVPPGFCVVPLSFPNHV